MEYRSLTCFQLPPSPQKFFFNLSSTNLTEFEPIINLGLKHIPRPTDTSNEEIMNGIEHFKHKLGWQYFFRNSPSNGTPLFKNENPQPFHFSKPLYHLPLNVPAILQAVARGYTIHNPTRHITSPAQKLKRFLTLNPHIKMVASDKNLGLVAINLVDYHQLVQKHLDSNKYVYVEPIATHSFWQPSFNRTRQRLSSLYENHIKDNCDVDIVKFFKKILGKDNPKIFKLPAFHVLIKLHKGFNPLTSRPIVGAVNWFTTPVSILLSRAIKPLLAESRSIAINTWDVVYELTQFNNFYATRLESNNYIQLVTMDISNLYTNIDLDTLSNLLDHKLQPLFEFVCRNNYFEYDKQVYRQTNGIAMGTNAAPELANLYLMTLLDPHVERHPNIVLYKRYLDDLLFFWTGNTEDLQLFIEDLNNLIPGIVFEANINPTTADFLDLHIKYENGGLTHATHQKKLNKYGYITPSTCHPRHTLAGFIKAELNRYAVNSSRYYYYSITKQLFYKRLLARGYQHRFLEPIFAQHFYSSRIASTVNRNSEDKIILPLRYSFRPGIMGLARNLKLHSNPVLAGILPTKSLMIAWKKSPNLFSLLTSSKLTEDQSNLLRDL